MAVLCLKGFDLLKPLNRRIIVFDLFEDMLLIDVENLGSVLKSSGLQLLSQELFVCGIEVDWSLTVTLPICVFFLGSICHRTSNNISGFHQRNLENNKKQNITEKEKEFCWSLFDMAAIQDYPFYLQKILA